jgi:hypothetical protein
METEQRMASGTSEAGGSAGIAVFEGNALAGKGVRSCYNCRHQKLGVYDKPCVDCLGSSVRNRTHFEAAEPNAANQGLAPQGDNRE